MKPKFQIVAHFAAAPFGMGIYAKSLFFGDVGIGLNLDFYLRLHGAILFFSY